MTKQIGRLVGFVLIIAVIGLLFFQKRLTNIVFPNLGVAIPLHDGILGIDVSHHQGRINWSAALKMNDHGDSIAFVFLKATEGLHFTDPEFDRNQQELQATELKYGAYHFYDPKTSAKAQARFFSLTIGKTPLKPVLDFEVADGMTGQAIKDSAQVFQTRFIG